MKRAVKKSSSKRSVAKKLPPKRRPMARKPVRPVKAAKAAPKGPSPIPPGQRTVTPHLVFSDAGKAMDFYKTAFGAVEVMRMNGPNGGVMHGEMTIGDSFVYMADHWPGTTLGPPDKLNGTTVAIHLYVKDCDALFSRAVAAGCQVAMPPMNMFWGDRFAKVTDPFGHSWSIATHVEDVGPKEMEVRMAEAMKQMGQCEPPTA
jgi:PhnB protein